MKDDIWWNPDKTKRLTVHKCGHCGQMKVFGWQHHQPTFSPPEGSKHHYSGWHWVSGDYSRNPIKHLLCDSCLHFEDRIAELKDLEDRVEAAKQYLEKIHKLSEFKENSE